ncbi:hypothetical protein BG418_21255 [Streptomyces sp. CBMA152]|nr:hypothetical protein [Streptomyces sp. CBMA152]
MLRDVGTDDVIQACFHVEDRTEVIDKIVVSRVQQDVAQPGLDIKRAPEGCRQGVCVPTEQAVHGTVELLVIRADAVLGH